MTIIKKPYNFDSGLFPYKKNSSKIKVANILRKYIHYINQKLADPNLNKNKLITLYVSKTLKIELSFVNHAGSWLLEKIKKFKFRSKLRRWVAISVYIITISIEVLTGGVLAGSSINFINQNSAAMSQVSKPSIQALRVSGGDLGKFSSPGSRAKNDARQAQKGKTIFAQGFQPQPNIGRSGTRVTPASDSPLTSYFNENGIYNHNLGPRARGAGPGPKPYDAAGASCGRPVKITSVKQAKMFDLDRDMVERDGQTVTLTSRSKKHLTSRHGHEVGIDDQMPPDPNQKPPKYKNNSIRTKITDENTERFGDIIQEIIESPDSTFLPEVYMRGHRGHGYFNENYGKDEGFFVGIHDEGEFAGQIKKAQSVSDDQMEYLFEQHKIQ